MKHEPIQHLFSQAAERYRDSVAIDEGGRAVAYGELEADSNKLANFLIASGAAKGSLVVVMSEKTVEVITALIGILKAGCVFVPLDSRAPAKRIEALLAEASPEWFVVDAKFIPALAGYAAAGASSRMHVICVDHDAGVGDRRDGFVLHEEYAEFKDIGRPAVTAEPDDMAYVYFTSGSTGRPKGIAGRLRAIDHFIRWELDTFGIGEGSRVSQLISPAFDAFLRDVFVPLCAGGTICVPEGRDTVLDARKLTEWINAERINLIHCVASLFRVIVNEELRPDYFSSLRHILISGEPLLGADVKRWTDVYGDRVQLVNLYGPSETTMTKFFHVVQPSDRQREIIPIGKPMRGAAAVVLGANRKPALPGTVGEIYIRTPFRSLGYYNQPELTKEVFIQNPLSDNPDDIVYKTGDLARMWDDGNFEFLGRTDQQVKIRGVRVEPREIENLFRQHEAVSDVAVIDRDDLSGNKYLCAYVVLGGGVKTSELGAWAAQRLPEGMVPSAFVVMDALPRTLSGKLDRRALPSLEEVHAARKKDAVAPRTPTEAALVTILTKVLGLGSMSVDDNFFELGGHSLLAMQVMARVQEATGVELPLSSLFEAPTVAALADRIETIRWAGQSMKTVPGAAAAADREELEI